MSTALWLSLTYAALFSAGLHSMSNVVVCQSAHCVGCILGYAKVFFQYKRIQLSKVASSFIFAIAFFFSTRRVHWPKSFFNNGCHEDVGLKSDTLSCQANILHLIQLFFIVFIFYIIFRCMMSTFSPPWQSYLRDWEWRLVDWLFRWTASLLKGHNSAASIFNANRFFYIPQRNKNFLAAVLKLLYSIWKLIGLLFLSSVFIPKIRIWTSKKRKKEKMRELAVRNNEIYMIFENGEYIRGRWSFYVGGGYEKPFFRKPVSWEKILLWMCRYYLCFWMARDISWMWKATWRDGYFREKEKNKHALDSLVDWVSHIQKNKRKVYVVFILSDSRCSARNKFTKFDRLEDLLRKSPSSIIEWFPIVIISSYNDKIVVHTFTRSSRW